MNRFRKMEASCPKKNCCKPAKSTIIDTATGQIIIECVNQAVAEMVETALNDLHDDGSLTVNDLLTNANIY